MLSWSRDDEKHELLTVVLVGDYSVGKTCIFEGIAGERFTHDTPTTIGVDFRTVRVKIDDCVVKVKMWDTAGMERFRSIVGCYFSGAQVVLMVCDCTNTESIDNLTKSWLRFMRASSTFSKDTLLYVIVNKWDIRRRMDREAGTTAESKKEFVRQHLRKDWGARKIFFLSAKTREGLEGMLGEVVKDARAVIRERGKVLPVSTGLRIVEGPPPEDKCCPCAMM